MSEQVQGKVAFIGCGNIAHVHMRFLKLAGVAVHAVCDASQTRVDLFADRYGIERRFTEVDTMLAGERPQTVHVLTPPHTHYPLIIKALKAGCNVLCEKPLCLSSQEHREVARLAAEQGLVVSVDHTRVHNPMISRAREVVSSGKLGRLVRMEYAYDDPSLIKADSGGHRWARGVPGWFEKLRGGLLTDLMPHPLSVFLSFDPKLRLQHVRSRTLPGGTIHELTAHLSSGEVDAVMNLSLNQKPLKNVFTVYCEKGSVRIDLRNMFCVYQKERRLPGIVSRVVVSLGESAQIAKNFTVNVVRLLTGKAHTYDGLDRVIADFYRAVAAQSGGEALLADAGQVALLVDEILDRALKDEKPTPATQKADRPAGPADYLVLGGSGFIGRRIVDTLLTRGKSARVLCRSARSAAALPPSAGVAFGDLRDAGALGTALQGIKTVVHCAAAMSGDWAEFHESTVQGTRNVLAALEGSTAKKLVYISSLGVLDYNRLKSGGRVDESSPVEGRPADRGFYTRAKVEAEELVLRFAESHPQIQVVILRPGLVYGHESNNNLQNCGIPLDRILLVFGLGKRRLGLTYVENLAQAVVLAAESALPSGSVLQIVDTEQPTVKEIIRDHNKFSGEKIIPIYVPIMVWKLLFSAVDLLLLVKDGKRGTFGYRFASNAKKLDYRCDLAVKELGWTPAFDTEQAFARTYLEATVPPNPPGASTTT